MGTRGTLMAPVPAVLKDESVCGPGPRQQPNVGAKLGLPKRRCLRTCVRLKGKLRLEAVAQCACGRG